MAQVFDSHTQTNKQETMIKDLATKKGDLISKIASLMSQQRWSSRSKAERQAWGAFLGKKSKQAWAKMTKEERSIEMRKRAVTREENRRKREEE